MGENDQDSCHGLKYKHSITVNIYFGGGKLTIKLNNHTTMDPMNQVMRRKTASPAKIVRNGGPWPALLVSFTSDPSFGDFPPTELGFVAGTLHSF